MAPVAFYVYTFGLHITSNHSRWGEMGSALSGIYTPILSLLTLVVLLAQVRLQERMNEHTFDQSYVQDARSDVQYYLSELAREVSREFDDGSEVGAMLVSTFVYASVEELASEWFLQVGKALNWRHHHLLSIWSAYYSILAGLKTSKYPPYTNSFEIAKQKAIMMLSYEVCAAFDQYMWCLSERRLSFVFEFAQHLQGAAISGPSPEHTAPAAKPASAAHV